MKYLVETVLRKQGRPFASAVGISGIYSSCNHYKLDLLRRSRFTGSMSSRKGGAMDMLQIFDTTLRDGEQSPGFSMNREEKLQLARQLEQLGVDVLEAGFPIASPGDLDATRAVAAEIKGCRVAALARARQEDVDAALRGLEPAAKPRLLVFLATSDLHLKYKLRMTREQALDQITKMVRFGRQHCEEVEFSAED